MSQVIPTPANCCTPCEDQVSVSVPGPAGADGADGANGNNGANSFCLTAAQFVQPAANANVDVDMEDARWISPGQEIFIENGGYYLVVAVVGNLVTVQNRDYTANANPGIAVPASSLANPSGEKGETGAAGTGSGDVQIINDLSEFNATSDAALANLNFTTIGVNLSKIPNITNASYPRLNADETVTAREFADVRTDLGLVIGTDVQAFDAALTSLSDVNNVAAADRLPYYDGASSSTVTVFTGFARQILAGATAAAVLVILNKVLPRNGLLAKLTAVDMNTTADTSMGITATRFRVTSVIVEAATATLATAPCTGGLFKTAGGLNPIAADQTLAACVAPTNFASLTLGGIGVTDVFIADLIFRVGTPAGFAATANVWVFGEDLS